MPPTFSGGKTAGVRWAPKLSTISKVIQDLRDPVYDEVYANLKPWVTALRTQAQRGAPWTDRTTIARRGLFAYRRKGKSFMTLALAHGPRTVAKQPWHGAPFYYGIALETWDWGANGLSDEDREFFEDNAKLRSLGVELSAERTEDESGHGTYAVVMPTMEANYVAIMASFKGALERAVRKQL